MISIDEIKTLVAFAELGSLTRASGRLHRTQPAISRRLGILEHELGAPMFERVRGNVRLTEAGRVFLPYAETALAALKDGCEAVRGLQTGLQGARYRSRVGGHTDRRRAAQVRPPHQERADRAPHRIEQQVDSWCGAQRRRWACATSEPTVVSLSHSTLATSKCW